MYRRVDKAKFDKPRRTEIEENDYGLTKYLSLGVYLNFSIYFETNVGSY